MRLIACFGCVVATTLLSCGAAIESTAESRSPVTDWDPTPYAPEPANRPTTGETVGIAASGGYDFARAVTVRLLRAVRDGNESELNDLLADQLVRGAARMRSALRSREQMVNAIAHHPRRGHFNMQQPVSQIINVDQLVVAPVSQRWGGRSIPSALQDTDLIVSVTVREEARRWLRYLLPGWRETGTVIVRPGATAPVVGL